MDKYFRLVTIFNEWKGTSFKDEEKSRNFHQALVKENVIPLIQHIEQLEKEIVYREEDWEAINDDLDRVEKERDELKAYCYILRDRLYDLWLGDDGQAYTEAERVFKRVLSTTQCLRRLSDG